MIGNRRIKRVLNLDWNDKAARRAYNAEKMRSYRVTMLNRFCRSAEVFRIPICKHWQQVAAKFLRRAAIVLLVVFLSGCGKENWQSATIEEKVYAPAATSVGPVVGTKDPGVVVTSTPERYILLIKFTDGYVSSMEVSASTWGKYQKGDDIQADARWWGISEIKR